MKLGEVEIGSNIAQNHSSNFQELISSHYLPKFRNWPKVKVDKVRTGSNNAQNHLSHLYEIISEIKIM